MTDIARHAGSAVVKNPKLDLFTVPPTDLSIFTKREVRINPFTTGINPVTFQIDPQEDYIDLSRSYVEFDISLKKGAGGNLVANESMWPVNNFAHSLIKQFSISLNGTLISPRQIPMLTKLTSKQF